MNYISLFVMSCIILVTMATEAKCAVNPAQSKSESTSELLALFEKDSGGKKELNYIKEQTLKSAGKAVPVLIEVMKNAKYPDKNRWLATFLLGRIMGKKSSPFVSRFLHHPSWVLRMASLKTLLALNETRYKDEYAMALKDKSYLVRVQALQNIKNLKLKEVGSYVWQMLYDKNNYYSPSEKGKEKGRRRTNIVKEIIRTVGHLDFKKATLPLLAMVQKDRYLDIFLEIDSSLNRLTGKKSPQGDMATKRMFWKRMEVTLKTI